MLITVCPNTELQHILERVGLSPRREAIKSQEQVPGVSRYLNVSIPKSSSLKPWMVLHPVLLDDAHREVLLEPAAGSIAEYLGQATIKIA